MKQLELAVYDFDGTLFPGDTLRKFWLWSLQHKMKAWIFFPYGLLFLILYGCKIISQDTLKQNFIYFITKKTLKNDVLSFWKTQHCFPWVHSRFEQDKKKGYTVVCISASPDFFLSPLTKKMKWDILIATPTNPKNPLKLGKNARGAQKVIYLNEWAKNNKITFEIKTMFSDRIVDKPLYDLAEKKFTVRASGKYYQGLPKK